MTPDFGSFLQCTPFVVKGFTVPAESSSRNKAKDMQAKTFLCPRCDFPLIPVHAQERGRRRIIALTCPEPYCDHMQMLPTAAAREIARRIATGDTHDHVIQGAG